MAQVDCALDLSWFKAMTANDNGKEEGRGKERARREEWADNDLQVPLVGLLTPEPLPLTLWPQKSELFLKTHWCTQAQFRFECTESYDNYDRIDSTKMQIF